LLSTLNSDGLGGRGGEKDSASLSGTVVMKRGRSNTCCLTCLLPLVPALLGAKKLGKEKRKRGSAINECRTSYLNPNYFSEKGRRFFPTIKSHSLRGIAGKEGEGKGGERDYLGRHTVHYVPKEEKSRISNIMSDSSVTFQVGAKVKKGEKKRGKRGSQATFQKGGNPFRSMSKGGKGESTAFDPLKGAHNAAAWSPEKEKGKEKRKRKERKNSRQIDSAIDGLRVGRKEKTRRRLNCSVLFLFRRRNGELGRKKGERKIKRQRPAV